MTRTLPPLLIEYGVFSRAVLAGVGERYGVLSRAVVAGVIE